MICRGEILAIDDDPDLLSLITEALSREGFAVSCAASGEEGLAKVTANGYDLVILDLMMPGMGGLAALREIKKVAPRVEVIILTAHGSVDSAVESMRLGAFDYLKKPFSITALAAAAGRAVEKKRFAEIAAAAFSAESPEGLMDVAAASAARLFGADEALLGRHSQGRGLKVSGFYGPGSVLPLDAAPELCRRGLELLAEAGAEVLLAVGGEGAEGLPGGAEQGSALFIALPCGEAGPGVLCVTRQAGRPGFGEDDLRRARVIGPLVALALKNSELNWDLRSARGQLLKSQKMEALGMLVGQVTHDFNNLLSVIIGSVQLLREVQSPESSSRISQNILDMAKGASALIKQLLSFSRRGDAPAAPADINGALEDVKLIIVKLSGKSTGVAYALEPGLPKVRIRPEHLKQVALNLALNARDAMPDGGRISVATRPASEGEPLPAGLKPGRYAVLEVSDEGPGIPEGDLEKIFEPFFTTKADGKGTGLGLHIVQGVAREYGGGVLAGNRPGGGAVFSVFLPAA
ncbi:MAG: hypothetical protein A2X32_06255 [Elusimicrobia bacterium GWC2_64_44]|nr:MAG: hypothetical protein A2X32_06255 [Elusimicrobia bacterium GWC2_64_44]